MSALSRRYLPHTIFLLCCLLYILALLLYTNQRDLNHSRFSRFVQKEGLIADFSSHHKPLHQILEANERNLRLTQALRVPPQKKGIETWQLIAKTARFFNPDLSASRAEALARLIVKKAEKHRIDPLLMAALISQESAFYEHARSPVGAYGYGQLMPGTADFLGVNSYDAEENLDGCAKYLRQQFDTWRNHPQSIPLVLASYNAGPGAVAHYGGIPPYRETQTYVLIVTERYETLRKAAKNSKLQS